MFVVDGGEWLWLVVVGYNHPVLRTPLQWRGISHVDGGGWLWLVVVGYNHPVLRTPLYFDFAQYKLWRGISRVEYCGMMYLGMREVAPAKA